MDGDANIVLTDKLTIAGSSPKRMIHCIAAIILPVQQMKTDCIPVGMHNHNNNA